MNEVGVRGHPAIGQPPLGLTVQFRSLPEVFQSELVDMLFTLPLCAGVVS